MGCERLKKLGLTEMQYSLRKLFLLDLPPGMEPVFKLGLELPTCQPCSFAEA